MRKLTDVIDEMLEIIPDTRESFINELESRKSSTSCTAPELMGMRWHEVHEIMCTNIPKPIEEWEFKVISIFSTKSIEEIKEIFRRLDNEQNT